MSNHLDRCPFGSCVSVDERTRKVRFFTVEQCIDALSRGLIMQNSVRTLLEKRLRRDLKTTRTRNMKLAEAIDAALAASERARNAD